MNTADRAISLVADLASHSPYFTGPQVVVWPWFIRRGSKYWLLDGGRIHSKMMFELFCLTKPIVALALIEACHDVNLDIDQPIRTRVDKWFHFDGAVTAATLCSHAARLPRPSGMSWMLMEPAHRPSAFGCRPSTIEG